LEKEKFFTGKIFLFVLVIFVFSAFYGYLNGEKFYFLLKTLKEIFGEEVLKLNPFLLFALIFSNNAFKSFIIIPLGVVLAIPPLLFILFNGFLVGLVAYDAVARMGLNGVLYFFAAILPHGVFELPAVFLSASLGVRVGLAVIRRLKGMDSVSLEIKNCFKIYLFKVLPLLLIGAIVEAYITPIIVNHIFKV